MAKKHSVETANLDLDDGVGEKKEDGKSQEWENNSRDGRASLPSEVFLRYFLRYFFEVLFRYFLRYFFEAFFLWKTTTRYEKNSTYFGKSTISM